ncbi:(2Fe-2S)-binding protein [Pelosinus propionicus]|uniref:Purine hydroxylase delta subunit apoprotein n=1 Tax=Pelosinus propionicus DSM 13327 TaxID=1123291 RepID=A0A1I4I428_9FIRM|nr:(2Fe-2S)-binding protein [Pelosinus propionicus]SFL48723.1 purine hydroxylase delta subunit apoprotein [Pelosinus propionicus DSM 13327]
MSTVKVNFILNNKPVSLEVTPDCRVIDMLRENLDLTGTKMGCGEGDCGACTIIIDGKTANSCLVLAAQLDGKMVVTIEGLGSYDKLDALQQAFIDEGAVQCGFCTPGMLLSAKVLLDHNPTPSRQEIMQSISGNLCRCTGYAKIANAIEKACGK